MHIIYIYIHIVDDVYHFACSHHVLRPARCSWMWRGSTAWCPTRPHGRPVHEPMETLEPWENPPFVHGKTVENAYVSWKNCGNMTLLK